MQVSNATFEPGLNLGHHVNYGCFVKVLGHLMPCLVLE